MTCIQADCSETWCTCVVFHEDENGENPFSEMTSTATIKVLTY